MAENFENAKIKGDISMSIYDLNKQIVSQLDGLSKEEKMKLPKDMKDFLASINNTYYMLICKDLSYYTLLKRTGNSINGNMLETIRELLRDHGRLITYSFSENKDCIEFWVKVNVPTEEEPNKRDIFCFLFFGYDAALVEVK